MKVFILSLFISLGPCSRLLALCVSVYRGTGEWPSHGQVPMDNLTDFFFVALLDKAVLFASNSIESTDSWRFSRPLSLSSWTASLSQTRQVMFSLKRVEYSIGISMRHCPSISCNIGSMIPIFRAPRVYWTEAHCRSLWLLIASQSRACHWRDGDVFVLAR